MKAMATRDRRALLRGLGVALGAVVLLRGVPVAARSIEFLRDKTVAQQATLARVEDVIVRGAAVRDSLAQTFHDIVALAPDLVDGDTPADAQAGLSAVLSLAASRHALKVVRVDPLPDSAAGVFHHVALHAELEGDIDGVTGLLASLESGGPLVTVSSLSIGTSDPAPHPRTSEALHVTLDVGGYYLARRDKR
jgi:Type II secretion system (T2SS), protein M subtype b